MNRTAVLEVAVLYLPIVTATCCWFSFRPMAKLTGPLLLSLLWNLSAVFALNQVAFYFNWWHYNTSAPTYHGLPLSIWFGWAVAWGLAAPLLPIKSGRFLFAAFLILDLTLMPLLSPLLVLGKHWIVGELIALGCVLMPGLAIYRWTLKQRALVFRVCIQAIIFFSIVGYFLPDLILTHVEKRPFEIPNLEGFIGALKLNNLLFWMVLGIVSVREFIKQGIGTPLPFDPPKRIVNRGLYAYISNPMQLATAGGLLSYGWILQSWGVVASGMMVVIYAGGLALPSEADDLKSRFGVDWQNYKDNFLPFIPRWSPINPVNVSKIYFNVECSTCEHLERWLKSKPLTRIQFRRATDYPGEPLERLKYTDGTCEYDGVEAFARALYHINLGWAIIAAFIQFPPFTKALQMIADANGFGATARMKINPSSRAQN